MPARLRAWASHPALDRLDVLLFAAALLVVGCLPWVIPNWPAVDLHNHLAVAHVIDSLSAPDSPYAPYFHADIRLVPSNGFYAILVALHQLFDLRTVGRLLLSFILLGIPLATLVFVRRAAPDRWRSTFLVFPLLTGKLFMLGLVSYFMSFAVALAALAIAWPPADGSRAAGDVRAPAVASVLLMLAAWIHPFAAGLTCFALLVREWRGLFTREGLVRAAVCTGPVALFVVLTTFTPLVHHPDAGDTALLSWDDGPLLRHDFNLLVGYLDHPWARVLRGLPLAILGLAAVYRALTARDDGDATLARVLSGIALLYVFGPASILPDFFIISPRVMLFGACLAAPMVAVPRAARRLAAPIGCSWLVLVTVWQWPDLVAGLRAISRMADLAPFLSRGSTLLPVALVEDRPYNYAFDRFVEERDVVVPYLMASVDGQPLGFRALGYKRPFSRDFLPNPGEGAYLGWDMPCAVEICERHRVNMAASLLESAQAYDYVLFMGPPEDLFSRVKGDFQPVAQVGEFRLVRPLHRR